jgi:hypothetical protein
LFDQLSTPWGLAAEVTFIAVIVVALVWRRRVKV